MGSLFSREEPPTLPVVTETWTPLGNVEAEGIRAETSSSNQKEAQRIEGCPEIAAGREDLASPSGHWEAREAGGGLVVPGGRKGLLNEQEDGPVGRMAGHDEQRRIDHSVQREQNAEAQGSISSPSPCPQITAPLTNQQQLDTALTNQESSASVTSPIESSSPQDECACRIFPLTPLVEQDAGASHGSCNFDEMPSVPILVVAAECTNGEFEIVTMTSCPGEVNSCERQEKAANCEDDEKAQHGRDQEEETVEESKLSLSSVEPDDKVEPDTCHYSSVGTGNIQQHEEENTAKAEELEMSFDYKDAPQQNNGGATEETIAQSIPDLQPELDEKAMCDLETLNQSDRAPEENLEELPFSEQIRQAQEENPAKFSFSEQVFCQNENEFTLPPKETDSTSKLCNCEEEEKEEKAADQPHNETDSTSKLYNCEEEEEEKAADQHRATAEISREPVLQHHEHGITESQEQLDEEVAKLDRVENERKEYMIAGITELAEELSTVIISAAGKELGCDSAGSTF